MREIAQKAHDWARENAYDDWAYGTRYSYCVKMLHAGQLTQDEFDGLEKYYGRLWHYRGD